MATVEVTKGRVPTPGRTGGPTYTTNTPGVPPVAAPPPPTAPPAAAPTPANAAPNGDAGYYTNWGGGNVAQQNQQITDASHAPAPLGFDATKWSNPSHTTTKYVAGRTLAAGGSIDDLLHNPAYAGWTRVGDDSIRSPDGNVYDLYYDYGGPNQRVQYTQTNDRSPNTGPVSLARNAGVYIPPGGSVPAWYHPGGPTTPPTTPPTAPPASPPQPAPLPGGGLPPGDPGSIQSSYTAQFSDPSTHQFEQYLMAQMQALEAQRDAQGKANAGLAGQQQQANQSSQQLVDYLRQRSQQLQAPAYTGSEAEVMRTQALDPIERDRAAANQRALHNIGSRGFDPTSGIAQQLMGDVNQGYDQQRAAAQGDLAYRQITEQRSRQQEAQALLAAIPQVQSGSAQQQLQFMQALDAALNKPREQGINLSQMLYRLPAQAQSDALQAMNGGGSSMDSLFGQAMGMYNAQNQQQQQGAQWYQMLGSMLPYLLGN